MKQKKDIKLLYIGSVLPDDELFRNTSFSKSGTMFQEELILSFIQAGISVDLILSYKHIKSTLKFGLIYINGGKIKSKSNLEINLLPFINITPIKQIMLGFLAFYNIIKWGFINRNHKYRIIYLYNMSVPPAIFILAGGLLSRTKVVISLNDINVPGETVKNNFFNRCDYFMQKKLIPYFDGHVVVADQIINDFSPSSPYIRVEGGVSETILDKFNSFKRSKLQSENEFIIVSVGALNEANGFLLLLKAFNRLVGDNFRLYIAGSGPLERQIKNSAQLDKRIQYLGLLSLDDVLKLYTNADLLLNLRITKSINTKYFFPGKMMEYLASGTPILTTCTGHIKSELSNFVYLLLDENELALSTALVNIYEIKKSERTALGMASKNYALKNLTWHSQGKKIAKYLENLF